MSTTPDPCTSGAAWGRLPGRSWSNRRCGRGTGWPALRCKRLGTSPGRLRGGPVRRLHQRSDLAGGRCPSHRRRTWSPSQPQRGRHTPGSPQSPHSTALRGDDKRGGQKGGKGGEEGAKEKLHFYFFFLKLIQVCGGKKSRDGALLSHKQNPHNLSHEQHLLRRKNKNSCNLSK